jgi:hypothetical protein
MDAFFPILLGAFILDAVIESVKMLKDQTLQWENGVAFLFGFFLASATSLNILQAAGLSGEGNLYLNMSYLTFAVIGMRGSGAIHDLYKRI